MNAVERALRDFLAVRPKHLKMAIVGGIAISARTEPRFTKDLDFAVAVASDADAEQCVFTMRQLGYEITAALEQVKQTRLSTVRLRRRGRGPLVDLIFAATGIENEIVAAAEPVEVVGGLVTEVACVGHLIAMKLVARDDKRRPQDQLDLAALSEVADDAEWARAEAAVRLIAERGFGRDRDLEAALAEWRERARVIRSGP
jgi:predicted nucleotidyltransferase